MVGIIVLMIVLCGLYVIYWFRHTYYLTRNDIDTYLYIQKKIDKFVEDYYHKHIYENYTYELGNWYINENKQDITIHYSYIDYHGNAECDSVTVSIKKLNKFDYFHKK